MSDKDKDAGMDLLSVAWLLAVAVMIGWAAGRAGAKRESDLSQLRSDVWRLQHPWPGPVPSSPVTQEA